MEDETTAVSKPAFEETSKLIGKKVEVHFIDKTKVTGYFYTRDPISDIIVLVNLAERTKIEGNRTGPSTSSKEGQGLSMTSQTWIEDGEKSPLKFEFITSHSYSNVLDISTNDDKEWRLKIEKYINEKFSTKNDLSELNFLNDAKLEEKKKKILSLLQLHRLPVKLAGNSIEVLDGLAKIEPPYNASCCHSSNPMVLDKIRKLITNLES